MYQILTADQAAELIPDGACICVNSFVGIENPVELHEALGRRYHETGSPGHLTIISSAGFGVWDEDRAAEIFCVISEAFAEPAAAQDREEADGEGHAAYKCRRREDRNVHDCKGHADSQGVNAGGHGEKEHGP